MSGLPLMFRIRIAKNLVCASLRVAESLVLAILMMLIVELSGEASQLPMFEVLLQGQRMFMH